MLLIVQLSKQSDLNSFLARRCRCLLFAFWAHRGAHSNCISLVPLHFPDLNGRTWKFLYMYFLFCLNSCHKQLSLTDVGTVYFEEYIRKHVRSVEYLGIVFSLRKFAHECLNIYSGYPSFTETAAFIPSRLLDVLINIYLCVLITAPHINLFKRLKQLIKLNIQLDT